ncbi:MAG: DivIVA domain-containing protein [Balneolales bacterium]
MNLTALEIKQQTFEKSLRGFDVTEVKSFLNLVSSEWEHFVSKMKDQETEISRLKDKIKHYEKVEEALHETLQSAKASAAQLLKSANVESETKIQKAELEAEKIIQTAQDQRREIRMETINLLDRRKEMVRGIKSYLAMAGESLDSFAEDESSIYKAPKVIDEPAPKADHKISSSDDDKANNEETPVKSAEEDRKVKYFSTDPDDMDDLLDEID